LPSPKTFTINQGFIEAPWWEAAGIDGHINLSTIIQVVII
jgi:hypothetical protein